MNIFYVTLILQGIHNISVVSFFAPVTSDPLSITFSITFKKDGSKKDTLNNIESQGDFVVNHVTKDIFPKVFTFCHFPLI
jgi:flavin reductase (DIM6/NTAB) family NADH-FMN oxidoreductase RutF